MCIDYLRHEMTCANEMIAVKLQRRPPDILLPHLVLTNIDVGAMQDANGGRFIGGGL